jgi:hypothetical protein
MGAKESSNESGGPEGPTRSKFWHHCNIDSAVTGGIGTLPKANEGQNEPAQSVAGRVDSMASTSD